MMQFENQPKNKERGEASVGTVTASAYNTWLGMKKNIYTHV